MAINFKTDSVESQKYLQAKASGKMLFEQVCKQLNLLETDYFGLEYTDNRGSTYWLDRDKPMNQQVIVPVHNTRRCYIPNQGGNAWRCRSSSTLYGQVLHA